MRIIDQPIQIETNSPDHDGCLVFADDKLVAVLVRLEGDYGEDKGKWLLEAGFGRVASPIPPTFSSMEEARIWISDRLRAWSGS